MRSSRCAILLLSADSSSMDAQTLKYFTSFISEHAVFAATLGVLVSCCMKKQRVWSCNSAAFGDSSTLSFFSAHQRPCSLKIIEHFPCYKIIWHCDIMLNSHNIVYLQILCSILEFDCQSTTWMKEEKGIRHRGEGTYLCCLVFTTVHFISYECVKGEKA